MKNKYSIFINSCDNTSDVARHFLMSFDKFIAVPKNIPIFLVQIIFFLNQII